MVWPKAGCAFSSNCFHFSDFSIYCLCFSGLELVVAWGFHLGYQGQKRDIPMIFTGL